MELVNNFEELVKEILDKYKNIDIPITIGILVADYRQDIARQYMLNYLNMFDKKSGKYIDFYLPGYYMYTGDTNNDWKERKHNNICISRHQTDEPIYIVRTNEKYYFDEYLFDEFIRDMEKNMNVEYTYNPMLLLVEVNQKKGRSHLSFQRKMIIELDNTNQGKGIKRAGCLFDEIFRIAKREVNIDRFGNDIKLHYIKGSALSSIAKALDGSLLEVLWGNAEQIFQCRIK
jgi:hypothetical protein